MSCKPNEYSGTDYYKDGHHIDYANLHGLSVKDSCELIRKVQKATGHAGRTIVNDWINSYRKSHK